MQVKIINQKIHAEHDDYKFNIYSQNGEDGLIKFFNEKMNVKNGYFVEFGAWDGRHLSNCANLAEHGWSGCFIEGDQKRFQDFLVNYKNNEKIVGVNRMVSPSGEASLDSILFNVGAPKLIDILSIDIDGFDYLIWESLLKHDARLVVVEFNPTIPANVSVIQDEVGGTCFGNSLAALWELGVLKGYELVACTALNAFFIRSDDCKKFKIPGYKPWELKDLEFETFLFHGYNGNVKLAGHGGLVWHGIQYDEEKFQILPRRLQLLPAGQEDSYFIELGQFKDKLQSK